MHKIAALVPSEGLLILRQEFRARPDSGYLRSSQERLVGLRHGLPVVAGVTVTEDFAFGMVVRQSR